MAALKDLIPQLKQHSAILVTGPQRSGTTIGGRIVAHELRYDYVDEEDINIAAVGPAKRVLERGRVVLQAPALCHLAHTFECGVVLMRRSVEEIAQSQARIQWGGHEAGELAKYGVTEGPIAVVKYRVWDTWQKALCRAAWELDYLSLENHPLWVPAERRTDFRMRQWESLQT